MGEISKLWLLSAALIAGAAAAYAAAVALYWRPCAGSMLNGSVLVGYRYYVDFSEECLVAMDQAPGFHLPAAGAGWTMIGSLSLLTMLLLAAAWLVLLPVLRVTRSTKLVAALPGVLGLVLFGVETARSLDRASTLDSVSGVLTILMELSVLIVVPALHRAGVSGGLLIRAIIVLLAATATGVVHQVLAYVVPIFLSDANWDSPPGSGYAIVAFLVAAAIATAVLWARTPKAPTQHAPQSPDALNSTNRAA